MRHISRRMKRRDLQGGGKGGLCGGEIVDVILMHKQRGGISRNKGYSNDEPEREHCALQREHYFTIDY